MHHKRLNLDNLKFSEGIKIRSQCKNDPAIKFEKETAYFELNLESQNFTLLLAMYSYLMEINYAQLHGFK